VPILSHHYHDPKEARTLRYYESAAHLKGCLPRAVTRAQFLLGLIPLANVDPAFSASLDRYGLGTTRTLKDFYDHAGLDVTHRYIFNMCPAAPTALGH
jgi:Glycosyltransferase (GlcNAc)